jgi:hypothetical protein
MRFLFQSSSVITAGLLLALSSVNGAPPETASATELPLGFEKGKNFSFRLQSQQGETTEGSEKPSIDPKADRDADRQPGKEDRDADRQPGKADRDADRQPGKEGTPEAEGRRRLEGEDATAAAKNPVHPWIGFEGGLRYHLTVEDVIDGDAYITVNVTHGDTSAHKPASSASPRTPGTSPGSEPNAEEPRDRGEERKPESHRNAIEAGVYRVKIDRNGHVSDAGYRSKKSSGSKSTGATSEDSDAEDERSDAKETQDKDYENRESEDRVAASSGKAGRGHAEHGRGIPEALHAHLSMIVGCGLHGQKLEIGKLYGKDSAKDSETQSGKETGKGTETQSGKETGRDGGRDVRKETEDAPRGEVGREGGKVAGKASEPAGDDGLRSPRGRDEERRSAADHADHEGHSSKLEQVKLRFDGLVNEGRQGLAWFTILAPSAAQLTPSSGRAEDSERPANEDRKVTDADSDTRPALGRAITAKTLGHAAFRVEDGLLQRLVIRCESDDMDPKAGVDPKAGAPTSTVRSYRGEKSKRLVLTIEREVQDTFPTAKN